VPACMQDILDMYSNEYLYLSCVKFVKQVGRGGPGHPLLAPLLGRASQ
jgi:hypothetical protein